MSFLPYELPKSSLFVLNNTSPKLLIISNQDYMRADGEDKESISVAGQFKLKEMTCACPHDLYLAHCKLFLESFSVVSTSERVLYIHGSQPTTAMNGVKMTAV